MNRATLTLLLVFASLTFGQSIRLNPRTHLPDLVGSSGSGSGVTSLNSETGAITITTGTSGTNFAAVTASGTITFNLPTASATNRGALSTADWVTFNNKSTVSSGAFASLPAEPCTSGTLYKFTNSWYADAFCGSTAWQYFLPVYSQATLPPSAGWTSVNWTTGTTSVNTSNGGLILTGTSGSLIDRGYVRTVPATPFTITWVFQFAGVEANFLRMGMCFAGDTVATNPMFSYNYNVAAPTTGLTIFSSPNWNNSPTVLASKAIRIGNTWAGRLADDGTTRTWSYSLDGVDWVTLFTDTHTSTVTFGVYGPCLLNSNGTNASLWLGSLQVQ